MLLDSLTHRTCFSQAMIPAQEREVSGSSCFKLVLGAFLDVRLAMAQMDIVCGLDSLMCRMSLLNPTIHCELNAMK